MSYCVFCAEREEHDMHRLYHDNHYGFPIDDDNELFGRLILEINQAGLSWSTILLKQDSFRAAYDEFNILKIANYDQSKIEQLLSNSGIIRNRLKIQAAVYNASQLVAIQQEFGSFKNWLDHNFPKTTDEWVKTFKKQFKFVGGEIVKEFLMSLGYLPGAHDETCIIFEKVKKLNPKWLDL
jgi:DNA-3-methyladenine glycosylase I